MGPRQLEQVFRQVASGPVPVRAAIVRADAATLQPQLTFEPSHFLTFAPTAVGWPSAPQRVQVRNTGLGVLVVSGVETKGDFAVLVHDCLLVAPGDACGVDVAFMPWALGERGGSLMVTSNAPETLSALTLLGTGTEAAPEVNLTSRLVEFGNQSLEASSPPLPVVLTNTGTAPLEASFAATGDFAVHGTTCDQALAAGESCWVFVSFAPTASGVRTGELTVLDVGAGASHAVALSGTGE